MALQERIIEDGLRALCTGLELAGSDSARGRHLEVLWWQFYICLAFHLRRSNAPTRATQLLQHWKRLNRTAALTWHFDVVTSREGILEEFTRSVLSKTRVDKATLIL